MERIFQYKVKISIQNKVFLSFVKGKNTQTVTNKLKSKFNSELIENSVHEIKYLTTEEWEQNYIPHLRDDIFKLVKDTSTIKECDEIALSILNKIRLHLTKYLELTTLARPTSIEHWCDIYWDEGLGDISFALQEYSCGYQGSKKQFVSNIISWIKKRFEERILIEQK